MAILSLVFCLPLVWTIEVNNHCGSKDEFRCGHSCIKDGDTCTCGNTSWKANITVDGCCPYSSNSCIKEEGKNSTFNLKKIC